MIKIANSENRAKQLSRAYREGKLRKIHHGIYTDDFKSNIQELVIQHWMQILPYIVSKGILGLTLNLSLVGTYG